MSSTGIEVKFTGPADAEISAMTSAETGGEDPKKWHIEKVKEFAAAHASELPGVTVGRVRKGAHPGGDDPNEPDHITVSYKAKNKDIPSKKGGAWHVYTGRKTATASTGHGASSTGHGASSTGGASSTSGHADPHSGHTGGGAGTGK